MQKVRGGWQEEHRRDVAWAVVLLAGVLVGLVASLIGVLIDDFVVGVVVVLVPSAVLVGVWWRRFLR